MTTNDRLHALDAVRAFALLLGLILHATMSFFMAVPVADSSQSATLAVTFFVIHVFRMTTFFVIAGFFAHMLLHRRGVRAFVKDRAKRILTPMLGGWVILAPMTIGVIVWGATRKLGAEALEGELPSTGLPLLHLWFLYYLVIFYALALGLRSGLGIHSSGARVRAAVDRAVRAAVASRIGPFALGAPLLAVLYFSGQWELFAGIPTPDLGLMPKLPALIGFGAAFALGWFLHRQIGLLAELRERWRANLCAAIALTGACLMIVGAPGMPALVSVDEGAWRLAYAAGYTAAGWYWTFGIIGAALRFFSKPNAVRRYLADSSYWLYLAHLPIVFFLQVALADLPWHWTVKFPLILAIALLVLLVSYHYLVRPTLIGQILNGRKRPRRPSHQDARAPDSNPSSPRREGALEIGGARAPVAALAGVTKRYGETMALDGVDLEVKPGELLALLGPNGAGKSTAISIWLGLLEPDAGSAQLMGWSPLEPASRLEVGIMLQEVNLPGHLRARELIELTASYYRDPLSVDETLALTQTQALAQRRYTKLSSGQKRQVQFAVAVCGRPRLLFLDEPTVGLDVKARQTMWRTIRGLLDGGCSIVLTTHYLEEAEALADRVAVLAGGRLVAEGTVEEMRALVARKRISCHSGIEIGEVKRWPGVVDAVRDAAGLKITACDAEGVVRCLLAADESLTRLEVTQATLTEAFTELTKEAA